MLILLFFQIIFLIYFVIRAKSVDQKLIDRYKEHYQLAFLAPFSICLTENLKLMDRFSSLLHPIHHRVVSLYSYKEGMLYTKLFIAQLVGSLYLCFFLATAVTILATDILLFYYGFFLSFLLPLLLIKGLDKQIKKSINKYYLSYQSF